MRSPSKFEKVGRSCEVLHSTKEQFTQAKNEVPDFIHLFIKSANDFETKLKKINKVINKNRLITIWVSWYKKSAKIPTDVTEDVIRNYALKHELVDDRGILRPLALSWPQ